MPRRADLARRGTTARLVRARLTRGAARLPGCIRTRAWRTLLTRAGIECANGEGRGANGTRDAGVARVGAVDFRVGAGVARDPDLTRADGGWYCAVAARGAIGALGLIVEGGELANWARLAMCLVVALDIAKPPRRTLVTGSGVTRVTRLGEGIWAVWSVRARTGRHVSLLAAP